MRTRNIKSHQSNIPVLKYSENPSEDSMWTSLYGNVLHPDFSHPTFFRHNGANVNLFNWYNQDTVYLIGRGPSLGKIVENKTVKNLLLHPSIVKFGMNTSPEILDNRVNLWAGVDKLRKFPESIYKNPNIMKFLPMNRYQVTYEGNEVDAERGVAYKSDHHVLACHCANTVGVQTFLLEQGIKTQMSFGNSYLGSTAVLYGYYKGMKSVFLFALKICLLLGFKKIVLLGVDFDMNTTAPYYLNTLSDYNKFHVDHNNKLYVTLSPLMKEIYNLLESGVSGYKTKIFTANKIKSMPFIPTINIKEELEQEIQTKS